MTPPQPPTPPRTPASSTTPATSRERDRVFLPAGFNGALWADIERTLNHLLARAVGSTHDVESWLLDRSDLDAACSEARANLYIATTANTDDAAINDAYTRYLDEVAPKLEIAAFDLDRRQVELTSRFRLDQNRYFVLERSKRTSVEIFREENVPILTELAKLAQDFGKAVGAQTVVFDGAERTLAQMSQFLQLPDRAVRESAWRTVAQRRLQDRATLDNLLDQMVNRRDRVARNAGFPDFIAWSFKRMERFDYTPEHCRRFREGVHQHVVPLMRRLDEHRRRELKLDALRPWDLQVDVKGRDRLRPFEGGHQLFARTAAVMEALDPRLAAMIRRLGDTPKSTPANGHTPPPNARGLVTEFLDLDSRKGKRPGGYMYMRDLTRRPFIFMNAAGLHRDAMTMVHEAGHAFHSMLSAKEPLVAYRESPIEFAEVASMSMEHLTMPHWGAPGAFYADPADARRARREHLEDSITLLAWIATIDAFQHWMYTHPAHTHAQRDDHWLELDGRFGHAVSWKGLDDERRTNWQRQGHLFTSPLYYIEYGIAQLGALGMWVKSRTESPAAAVDAYIRALSLGGSKPLPDLFAAAGLPFDFGEQTISRITGEVERELEALG